MAPTRPDTDDGTGTGLRVLTLAAALVAVLSLWLPYGVQWEHRPDPLQVPGQDDVVWTGWRVATQSRLDDVVPVPSGLRFVLVVVLAVVLVAAVLAFGARSAGVTAALAALVGAVLELVVHNRFDGTGGGRRELTSLYGNHVALAALVVAVVAATAAALRPHDRP